MHRRLLPLAVVLVGLASTLSLASAPARADSGQIAYFLVGPDGRINPTTQNSTATATDIFRNDPGTAVSFAQNGQMWADDVHAIGSGPLLGFQLFFQGSPTDSFDVTVAIYSWSGDAVPPGPAIVGPYTFKVSPFAIGAGIGFVSGPVVGPDMWLAISFSDPTMGLWLHDPPSIGTSHDLFWNFATNSDLTFPSGPVANAVCYVTVDVPTPVEPTTWGKIKKQF
jgi:hypothetical protein